MSYEYMDGRQTIPMGTTGVLPPSFSQPQPPLFGNLQPVMPMQQQMAPQQQQIPANVQQAMINPASLETPNITGSGKKSFFSVIKEDGQTGPVVPVDLDVSNSDVVEATKRRSKKKESGTGIIRADAEKVSGTVEDMPTIYSYGETTAMLKDIIYQIDQVDRELSGEFESVLHSRTLKNKHNIVIGYTESKCNLLNNKIAAIKEINASITKANDVDYKKAKDLRMANAAQDDDKYIADLYKSFISNPMSNAPSPILPSVDPTIFGSGVVRAELKSGDYSSNGNVDVSYLNYISNLTPEQNLMRFEGDPNVKQVVVFDAATGNKFFQMMNVATGEVIPNVPVYDSMFMDDTTLDLHSKVAKNINLNETFPIVIINQGVTGEY